MPNRRDFLGLLGAGAALPALTTSLSAQDDLVPRAADWDMSWVDQVSKPYRVVIDAPSITEGSGLWRSVLLRDQYREVYGTYPDQMASVLVLRHEAIVLAMDHSFWEQHGAGEMAKMKDKDDKWVTRNPIGPPADDARAGAAKYTIPGFLADGGIVLGCNMAFGGFVVGKYRGDGVSRDDARAEALKHLLPGVILQPSGFFAVVRAQQAGCVVFSNL